MSATTLKFLGTILLFYTLGLLFSCLSTWFFDARNIDIEFFKAPIFWVGPLIFIGLGLFIGGIVSIMDIPKNKTRFLFYATLTGLLLFVITISSFQFNQWYHSRYLANIDANESFLNSNCSYPLPEKQAFRMLADKYKNPNDLRLSQMSVRQYDSIVDRIATKAYEVGFIYYRKNRRGRYKASCTIIGSQGNFQYFDRALNDLEEYLMDSSDNGYLREGLKTVLTDSVKLGLDSTAKETIRNKIKSKKIALDTLSF